MDRVSRPKPRFDGALNPAVQNRRVLASKMYAALRCDNLFVEQSLLPRIEQRKRTASVFILVPNLRSPGFKLDFDLRMNLGNVFQGLRYTLIRCQRSPAVSVICPRIASNDNAASSFA